MQVSLSEKSQDAVLALGIFFLESGCSARCADHVVPYLVGVERALAAPDAVVQPRNGGGPKKDQERRGSFGESCTPISDLAPPKGWQSRSKVVATVAHWVL